MSFASRAGLLALCLILTAAPASASASTIKANGSAYTGAVNVRLSSSAAQWATSTGNYICTSNSGTNPRLASFGTGNVTNSAITSTLGAKATLTRLSFGNPLLANSTNTHDSLTTVFATFPTAPNSTPRCASTVSAWSGGCVMEARPVSPNNTIFAQDVKGGFQLSLTTTVTFACTDGGGGVTTAAYTTGATAGTPGPITSNVISYNTGGTTAASTAVFSNQPLYRSSGSSFYPARMNINASYQLYTGTAFPGGSAVYATNP